MGGYLVGAIGVFSIGPYWILMNMYSSINIHYILYFFGIWPLSIILMAICKKNILKNMLMNYDKTEKINELKEHLNQLNFVIKMFCISYIVILAILFIIVNISDK